MDQQTIDKLMELKKLYEAGILTQEEVEAEKKKILNPQQEQPVSEPTVEPVHPSKPVDDRVTIDEDAVPIMRGNDGHLIFEQPKVEQPADTVGEPTPTSEQSNVWVWVSIGLIVVLVFIMLAKSSCSGTEEHDNLADLYITEEVTDSVSPEYADEPIGIDKHQPIADSIDNEDVAVYDLWSGDYVIEGEMYRMTTTNALLHLVPLSDGSYTGSIQVTAGDEDDDWYFGTILGDVDGTPNGSELSLTISRIRYANALSGDNIFDSEDYEKVTNGDVIFTLYTDGAYYKAKAIGTMKDYFDNITEPTTITKL